MKKQLLFIDDEPRVLHSIGRMLREFKDEWNVQYAVSAQQAYELLAQQIFDLVVIDLHLPDGNGLKLLDSIKTTPRSSDTEVIVFTGAVDRELKSEALNLGAADLLNKPLMKENLLARLNSTLLVKQYQDELKERNRQLNDQLIQAQKMQLIGMLAAGMTHDFKNILAVIQSISEFIAANLNIDREADSNLDKIVRLCHRGEKVVHQMLTFSRPDETEPQRCNLEKLFEDSIQILEYAIPKTIVIDWRCSAADPVTMVNATQLFQLFLNLTVNAVQALDTHGRIEIALEDVTLSEELHNAAATLPPGHYLVLTVSDNGDGIDRKMLQQLFTPFASTRESNGGAGIGLFVAQHIARIHHGLVTAESAADRGTTFRTYLPYQSAEIVQD